MKRSLSNLLKRSIDNNKRLVKSPKNIDHYYSIGKIVILNQRSEAADTDYDTMITRSNIGEIIDYDNDKRRVKIKWSQVVGERIEYGPSSHGTMWFNVKDMSNEIESSKLTNLNDVSLSGDFISIKEYDNNSNCDHLKLGLFSNQYYKGVDMLTKAFVMIGKQYYHFYYHYYPIIYR